MKAIVLAHLAVTAVTYGVLRVLDAALPAEAHSLWMCAGYVIALPGLLGLFFVILGWRFPEYRWWRR